MHNDFLLGQNHVWSPVNGTMASAADQLVQTADFVWLIVGTNDYSQQVPTATFIANIADIVDYIELRGAVPIVINSSVGWLDSSLPDASALLNLSQDYAVAQQAWFDQR